MPLLASSWQGRSSRSIWLCSQNAILSCIYKNHQEVPIVVPKVRKKTTFGTTIGTSCSMQRLKWMKCKIDSTPHGQDLTSSKWVIYEVLYGATTARRPHGNSTCFWWLEYECCLVRCLCGLMQTPHKHKCSVLQCVKWPLVRCAVEIGIRWL